MPRYAKGVEGVDHYYQPEDLFKYAGEPFDVRVSIFDEPVEQSLWATVPAERIGGPIGEILDELVIGSNPSQTEFIRDNVLDLDDFPHLSDALDKVADVWHRVRSEEGAAVGLCVNNGADDIALEDTAREHMSTCVWQNGELDYMLLDLVLEPSEMTLAGMLGERKQEFFLWLQGIVALYKLDTDSSAERQIRKRDDLADAREQLFFHNLVSEGPRGKLEITQQGRRAIGRLMEEQDELIARYDIFRDVVTRREGDGTTRFEFATLAGADYRVAVYEHLGVDPFRAVFLLTLLSGELDDELGGREWVTRMTDERFYEEIFRPVVERAEPPVDELDNLVKEGELYLARTAALRDRARYSESVLARGGMIQAFPRPSTKGSDADEDGEDEEPAGGPALPPKARPTPLPAGANGPTIPTRRRPFKKAAARGSTLPPPTPKGDPERSESLRRNPGDDGDLDPDLAAAEREIEEMLAGDDGESDRGPKGPKRPRKRKGFRRGPV